MEINLFLKIKCASHHAISLCSPSNMKHMDLNSTLNDLDVGEDLDNFRMILTIIKVLFVTFGGILQLMIIHFERFGRDSAKRSLVNRVSKTTFGTFGIVHFGILMTKSLFS